MSEKESRDDLILCKGCYKLLPKNAENCSFCGEETEKRKNTVEKLNIELPKMILNYSKISIVGMIVAIISFLGYFISPLFSILLGTLSLILAVIGTKETLKLYGMIVSLGTLVLSTIMIVGILIFSDDISISNTVLTSTKYIHSTGAEGNYESKDNTYANWLEDKGKTLLVLKQDGSFAWYQDKNNLEENYISGVFQMNNGFKVYDDIIYDDGEFYYYNLIITKINIVSPVALNGVDEHKNQEEYIFTLEKEKQVRSCIQDVETREKTCFIKEESNIENIS